MENRHSDSETQTHQERSKPLIRDNCTRRGQLGWQQEHCATSLCLCGSATTPSATAAKKKARPLSPPRRKANGSSATARSRRRTVAAGKRTHATPARATLSDDVAIANARRKHPVHTPGRHRAMIHQRGSRCPNDPATRKGVPVLVHQN